MLERVISLGPGEMANARKEQSSTLECYTARRTDRGISSEENDKVEKTRNQM